MFVVGGTNIASSAGLVAKNVLARSAQWLRLLV
jgi:hypothetical protein